MLDDVTRHNLEWLLSEKPRRARAAQLLADDRSPEALEPFLQIAADPADDEDVRKAAIVGLGRLGEAKAVPVLMEIVTGPSPAPLREAAIEALGEIGPAAKKAVDPLVTILLDDSGVGPLPLIGRIEDRLSPLRKRAAKALGQIGDPRALGPLTFMALKSDNQAIKEMAIDSLKYLGWRK